MPQAELERITELFDGAVRERLQGAPVRAEVLQYGDIPEIEPGQFVARVVLDAPDDPVERMRTFKEFHEAHIAAVHELRETLDTLPLTVLLQVVASSGDVDEETGPRIQLLAHGGAPHGVEPDGLTTVHTRVGPEDLETLDTLIAAGVGTSRAEVMRWALARIRERPAYAQLRARTREIADLTSQF